MQYVKRNIEEKLKNALLHEVGEQKTTALPILISGGKGTGKYTVINKVISEMDGWFHIYSDCQQAQSSYPAYSELLLPLEEFISKMQLLDELEAGQALQIVKILHGRIATEGFFKQARSFYGFKHTSDLAPQIMTASREFLSLLRVIGSRWKIVLHFANFEFASKQLIQLLDKINTFRVEGLQFIISYDEFGITKEIQEFLDDVIKNGGKSFHLTNVDEKTLQPYFSDTKRNKEFLRNLDSTGRNSSWKLTLIRHVLCSNGGTVDSNGKLDISEEYLKKQPYKEENWLQSIFQTWFVKEQVADVNSILVMLSCFQRKISKNHLQRSIDKLGLNPQTVALVLTKLQLTAVVKEHTDHFTILNKELLEEYILSDSFEERIHFSATLLQEYRGSGLFLDDHVTRLHFALTGRVWREVWQLLLLSIYMTLQFQAINHALLLLQFASESILPRIPLKSVKEQVEFHLLFGNTLVLDNQINRAEQQFSIVHENLKKLDADVVQQMRTDYLLDIAFLELFRRNRNTRKAKEYLNNSIKLAPTPMNRIATSNQLALTWYLEGDLEMSRVFYSDNLKMLMMKKNDEKFRIEMDSTLRGLSSIAQRMGELRKSISYLNELMNLYCEDEGSEVLAHTYQYRGMILTKRGDFQDATKDFDKSLELYDQLSDLFGRARVLINLGQTLLLTGETTRAHKIFRESLVISQKLGNPKGEAISLGNLAQIMVLKGNFSEAHNMLGTDLKISRQINDHFGVVFAQLYKASAYFWERKFKKSLDLFKECNATATKRKLYQPMVSSGIGIVRVLLETGEIAAAVTALDEIEKQMEHREDPIIEARFQAVNAELEIAQGKYSKATRCLNTAYLTFEKTGLIFEQALCLLKEAKIALAQGAKETYVTRLGDARSLFMKMEADYFFRNANHFLGPDFSDTSNNEEDNQ